MCKPFGRAHLTGVEWMLDEHVCLEGSIDLNNIFPMVYGQYGRVLVDPFLRYLNQLVNYIGCMK